MLTHLRQATQSEHLQVERHALLSPLISSQLDRHAYTQVLGAMLGYFHAFEPALCAAAAALCMEHDGSYRYLPRVERLKRDLIDLDAGEAMTRTRLGGPLLPVPGLESPDHVLGTLYVLEGATQGGRVIAPRVNRALGLDASRGARYFHLYAERQWQAFRALVSSRESRYDPERAASGARDTFNALGAHLDAWLGTANRS